MKLNFSRRKSRAMTVFEVMVVVACVLFLAALLLPTIARQKRHTRTTGCVMNLRQVGLAFRIWEGDNANQFPMAVSVTNGGAMELMEAGNLAGCFQTATNELPTPKILVCPNDTGRTFAPNWSALSSAHISYFLGVVSNEDNPAVVFSGDDNVAIGGGWIKRGLQEIPSNSPVGWSGTRHGFAGNIGFADGSVMTESSSDLQVAFQKSGLATNRIVIP